MDTGWPFTHEPLSRMCSELTTGITCRLEPFATFTHDSWNVVARVCTVPLAQFALPPVLPVGVGPPALVVGTPGLEQAANRTLPSANIARNMPRIRRSFRFIVLLSLSI